MSESDTETEYDELVTLNKDNEFEYEIEIPETTATITFSRDQVIEYIEETLERPLTEKEKKKAWHTFTWSDAFARAFPSLRCTLGESDWQNYNELYKSAVEEAVQEAVQNAFDEIWDNILCTSLEEALKSVKGEEQEDSD